MMLLCHNVDVCSAWRDLMHNLNHSLVALLLLVTPHVGLEYVSGAGMSCAPLKALVSNRSLDSASIDTIVPSDPMSHIARSAVVGFFRLQQPELRAAPLFAQSILGMRGASSTIRR